MRIKIVFLFLIGVFMVNCAGNTNVKESPEAESVQVPVKFSDTGAVSLYDDEYLFTVILVEDIEFAISSLERMGYGLPHISKFEINKNISPFLTFLVFKEGNFNLTYDVKLKKSYETSFYKEFNDLIIARADSELHLSMTYPAEQFASIQFDESGTYQFHITIKEQGEIRTIFIIEFEVSKA